MNIRKLKVISKKISLVDEIYDPLYDKISKYTYSMTCEQIYIEHQNNKRIIKCLKTPYINIECIEKDLEKIINIIKKNYDCEMKNSLIIIKGEIKWKPKKSNGLFKMLICDLMH